MKPSMVAAVEVARRVGIDSTIPTLVQETNNTVVWLRPHEVIAKVGTHPDSAGVLAHEHRVASALAEIDASVAVPVAGAGVEAHEGTGFTVTLWCRLQTVATNESAASIAESLRGLHRSLAMASLDLPPYGDQFERAHAALFSDVKMAALAGEDRAFLREAFEGLWCEVGRRQLVEQPLHGEPHEANRLHTASGIRWIDFEGACRGPIEWDLAFLPERSLAAFGEVDLELLDLLGTLNAARRATWGWVQARFPEMRRFGEEQLRVVRARLRRSFN